MNRLNPQQLALAAQAEAAVNAAQAAGAIPQDQRQALLASVWRSLATATQTTDPTDQTTAALLHTPLESEMNTLNAMHLIQAAGERLSRQLQALDALPPRAAKPAAASREGAAHADIAAQTDQQLHACLAENWARAGDLMAALATASARPGQPSAPAHEVIDVEAREVTPAAANPALDQE